MNMLDFLIWAQQRQPFGPGVGPGVRPGVAPTSGGEEMILPLLIGMACFWGVLLLMGLVTVAGVWKAFTKAGEPGWAAIVPVYNMMIMSKIAGRGETYGLLTLIPIAGIIFMVIILLDFVKKYGHGPGYAIAMLFFPYVLWPMLGFGSSRYVGGRKKRSRYDDDEEEEEDERPRRRRPRDEEEEEEEERPRRRRAVAEDDEEEERPKRPSRPAAQDEGRVQKRKRKIEDDDD